MALGKDLVERIERDVAGVYLNGVQAVSYTHLTLPTTPYV